MLRMNDSNAPDHQEIDVDFDLVVDAGEQAVVDVQATNAGSEIDDSSLPPDRGVFDRRSLLLRGLALGAMTAGAGCRPSWEASAPTTKDAGHGGAGVVPAASAVSVVPLLAALAERLLPSDERGPGAKEANVAAFLERAVTDERLQALSVLLQRGCAFLDEAAQSMAQVSFVVLDAAQKDELIGRLVDGHMRPDGFSAPTFLRVALALTLEGFLGDPRHGGNAGSIGWQFFGFAPDDNEQDAPPKTAVPALPRGKFR